MNATRILAALALLPAAAACSHEDAPGSVPVPGRDGARKTSAAVRAARRAYDGAPPVVPHAPFGAACSSCHTERGMDVPGIGFAPPSPHEKTAGLSGTSRCEQCHVFRQSEELFVANSYVGETQDLGPGSRAHEGAPPVLPHPVFMRENCRACHAGPAAREGVRCTHPERENCGQCHVERLAATSFSR